MSLERRNGQFIRSSYIRQALPIVLGPQVVILLQTGSGASRD